MESNGMPGQAGGMYSSTGSSGMLGLEMSLQHHHIPQNQQQNPQNPHHHMQQQQHQHHPIPMGLSYANQQQQDQMASKQGYPFVTKPKNPPLTLSDDDESNGLATENSADDGKTKATSPWHRMKWTDNMVRLLIMVVYYIGDEAGADGTNDPSAGKKKGGGSGGGGVLQKKGKWKSVSRAMMERGFYVSPQQCEDKFNDLNKRYKRVNDILGKGTACRVVENQNLLETMDHLSPKIKEEVKKLLNSKHLFFREMCAYHNSCGHGGGGGGGPQQSPEASSQGHRQQPPPQQPQPRCLHSTDQNGSNLVRGEVEVSKLGKRGEEDEDNYEDDNEDDEDDKEDEDDEEVVEGGGGDDDDDDNETDERSSRKRLKKGVVFVSPLIQQLNLELKNVFQDESKSALEKRQWMRGRMLQLEEQHVGYECAAFQLEKQRLKWLKFRNKKEREMEREKISNERMKLENERMSLLIRQKELELIDQYQQSSRKSDPSSITG